MGDKPVCVGSGTLVGVDAIPITIEVKMRGETGTPKLLGLVGPAVREAYHRVLDAFAAEELPAPRGVPVVNFVPAGLPKDGTGFDLPLALALAGAAGLFAPELCRGLAAYGEVSLRGRVIGAAGAVSMAIAARQAGWSKLLLHPRDAAAAALVPGITAYGVHSLREAVLWLRGEHALSAAVPANCVAEASDAGDLAEIRGHETPKRALAVAAAGRHNVLFLGPPGSGKSALIQRLPGLMPPLQDSEALDVLKIHSVGTLGAKLQATRPMRAPHHTSSTAALLGGGKHVRPGEVTLAQHGVLFLDELPEFRREALEGLRQPLEDRHITIGRAEHVVTMPADFILVAAMNPCPCGYHGHPSRPCVCTIVTQRRYLSRVSGPLLDRIDVQVPVPALPPAKLRSEPDPEWSTAALRERVLAAVERQRRRNREDSESGYVPNGRLSARLLARAVRPSSAVLDAVDHVMTTFKLSGRGRVRLLRLARTLADLEDRDELRSDDVLEAAGLRRAEALLR
jgi:magnesium chelatase family protein